MIFQRKFWAFFPRALSVQCFIHAKFVRSPNANFKRKLSLRQSIIQLYQKRTPFSGLSELCHIFCVLVGRADDLTKNHSVIQPKTNFGPWPDKPCCNADRFDVFVTSSYFPIRYMGVCLPCTPVSIVAYSALFAFSML
jgi:hypothetical protein